jgi:hypothetical protein
MVVLFPVTLFVVLVIVQFGIWYHASAVARAAAQQGVKAASAYGAPPGAGLGSAEQVLTDNGQGLIHSPTVLPSLRAGSVRVTVTGHVLSIVPLFDLPIRVSAQAPVEAYRPAGQP